MSTYITAAEAHSTVLKSGKILARIHISYTVTTGIGNGELSEIVDITQKPMRILLISAAMHRLPVSSRLSNPVILYAAAAG